RVLEWKQPEAALPELCQQPFVQQQIVRVGHDPQLAQLRHESFQDALLPSTHRTAPAPIRNSRIGESSGTTDSASAICAIAAACSCSSRLRRYARTLASP